ncbi:phosphoribosyltransferase [Plastoroseomonas hellenica]|uniref:phosphoribosyltransferase n=1 Tax=Plastoroseomonas hellenica TaxID=2687306 RepID=UPI001BAB92D1|nr:phosphoribosyltransferase [Plastoroseomonas hellenica]MBR0646245.1 phosphoribosyltransferase [Plastoroseomonas hellenica]
MDFWQDFVATPAPAGPWRDRYPARMPDGTSLILPLRDYGEIGVAGLIANQASFAVLRRLAGWMADAVAPLQPDVVVGMPSLGHVFGPLVAEALGHNNWVAPGYSRKRWYDEALSVPVASSTAPAPRALWLDPRIRHRLEGRRVLLLDDVISSGSSALAGLALLQRAGIRPIALLVAMVQGDRWRAAWPTEIPVRAAFATPLFDRADGGWVERPGTAPLAICPLMPRRDAA